MSKPEAVHDLAHNDAPSFHIPHCPWCGRGEGAWWEYENLKNDAGEAVITCACNHDFRVVARHWPEFTSTRVTP